VLVIGAQPLEGAAVTQLEGFEGDVVVLSGDVPNLSAESLEALIALPGAVRVLGMRLEEPAQYGRFVREAGKLVRIREFKDCAPEERAIRDVNAGVYAIDAGFLRDMKASGAAQDVTSFDVPGEFEKPLLALGSAALAADLKAAAEEGPGLSPRPPHRRAA
jgi:NDP-sugar pyrophosphorylase family protein